MNIVQLRDRLTEIIEINAKIDPSRNDAPVYFRLNRGRNDWWIPIRYASSTLYTIADYFGIRRDILSIIGYEVGAIKEGSRKQLRHGSESKNV